MWRLCGCSFALVLLLVGSTAHPQSGNLPCPVKSLCSATEDAVWATDGQKCYGFRNNCFLTNENCDRKNRNESTLRTLPAAECRSLCTSACTLEYRPVCAEYSGVEKDFANRCALDAHICETGETYFYLYDGDCGKYGS